MSLRLDCVCFDCADPSGLAAFWASLLGGHLWEDEDPSVELPGGPHLVFLKVPEGKAVKNRVHIDLRPDDQDAEVARAESLGASRFSVGQREDATFVVLADPEGNEFCILRAE